ncbi:MAG: hypothetical protein IIA83_07935 [Thaumarchaeota archaeon]|nr:hypothetical protein [Nitrososphaerota archaeon]
MVEIIKKLKEIFSTNYETMKIEEPDMRLINDEVDTLCHSVRREFERYEDDGIFEIDRIQKWLDQIEDLAFKIDDYEEKTAGKDKI